MASSMYVMESSFQEEIVFPTSPVLVTPATHSRWVSSSWPVNSGGWPVCHTESKDRPFHSDLSFGLFLLACMGRSCSDIN